MLTTQVTPERQIKLCYNLAPADSQWTLADALVEALNFPPTTRKPSQSSDTPPIKPAYWGDGPEMEDGRTIYNSSISVNKRVKSDWESDGNSATFYAPYSSYGSLPMKRRSDGFDTMDSGRTYSTEFISEKTIKRKGRTPQVPALMVTVQHEQNQFCDVDKLGQDGNDQHGSDFDSFGRGGRSPHDDVDFSRPLSRNAGPPLDAGPPLNGYDSGLEDLIQSIQSKPTHAAPPQNGLGPHQALVQESSLGPHHVPEMQHIYPSGHQATVQGGDQPINILLGDQSMLRVKDRNCNACGKEISGEVLLAMNHLYHPDHFRCAHCDVRLGTDIFYEVNGKPYCKRDFEELFSTKCGYCGDPIVDQCISALGQSFHPDHFLCSKCGIQLTDDGYYEKNGQAYCRQDYLDMFAQRCAGCNEHITGNFVSALHRQWHPQCFVCQECHAPFESGNFYEHDGLPFCEEHFYKRRNALCARCQKPIVGRCVTAMWKKYHPEHFVCCFCLQPLNIKGKGTFKEADDKPYCCPCFEKLFG